MAKHPVVTKSDGTLPQAYQTLSDAYKRVLALPNVGSSIESDHLKDTPERVSCMLLDDLLSGCWQDPAEVLRRNFSKKKYDEMIYVNDIDFFSVCAHHLVPFFGKVHFAYIPSKSIVGLSKIPRMIDILARRPQVQEKLTEEIVDTFTKVVKPLGCGVVIEAYHLCMIIRGIKKSSPYTKTTALRGNFRLPLTKDEFLQGVKHNGGIWP